MDLSGAHRFRDPRIYESWYGFEHPAPDTLTSWSYGLPEVSRPTGRLVANPVATRRLRSSPSPPSAS